MVLNIKIVEIDESMILQTLTKTTTHDLFCNKNYIIPIHSTQKFIDSHGRIGVGDF